MSFIVTAAIAAIVAILANSAYANGECAVTPGAIAAIALLANAVSVDGACSDPYDGKGATVDGDVLKEDANGIITIPAVWTAIPEWAFADCTDLKRVLIPANIREIEQYAFWGSGLVEVLFEANSQLEIIGRAFESTNIVKIVIPKSVTEIQSGAFYSSALEVIEFEANSELVSIGDCAFRFTNITSVEIPSSVAAFHAGNYDTQCSTVAAFAAEGVFECTPCPDKSVFKPGTAVENCEIVTTSVTATAPPTTASPTTSATAPPTNAPSHVPSDRSAAPSLARSAPPTSSSTASPSTRHSPVPSVEPMQLPSRLPSHTPVFTPIDVPSPPPSVIRSVPPTLTPMKPTTSAGFCSVVDVGIRKNGQLTDCAEIGRRLDCGSVKHLAACPNFCACSYHDLTKDTLEGERTECEAKDDVAYYLSSRGISLCTTIVALATTKFCDYVEVRAYCPKTCACWNN